MNIKLRWLSTLGLAGICATCALAGVDATNFYNPNFNPNGAVSFTNGPFNVTPMTVQIPFTAPVSGSYVALGHANPTWSGPYPYTMVGKTSNTDAFDGGEGTVLPRNQLFATTGIGTDASSWVRFTFASGGTYDVIGQVWRPPLPGNGHGAELWWTNPAGVYVLPIAQTPGQTRPVPRWTEASANGGTTFFAIRNFDLSGNVSWDTSCVNLSAVRLDAGPRPMAHGVFYLPGWQGRYEEHSFVAEVRNNLGNVLATGTGSVMSTGQFEINFSGSVPNNVTLTIWMKLDRWLAFKYPFAVFSNGVVRIGNTPQFNTASVINLVNGDIDNDNYVSILDYIYLSTYYELQRKTNIAFWNAIDPNTGVRPRHADLDGDDEVSILDYIILSSNYDQQGAF